MNKILGLDLGSSSIGWALISENDENRQILGMGTRIIPLTVDDKNEFSSGNAISKNQKRTTKRTQRKGYDRYQLRRKYLINELKANKMLPDDSLVNLSKMELWRIRSTAVTEKLTLKEIGRVLLHLNQKRGYKSARSEANLNKKDTEYVSEVKGRYEALKEEGLTIGQKFYSELEKDQYYRIKEQIFPREAYIEEFDKIIRNQQKYYKEIITDQLIARIKDEIIYYQRKLKSQKGLVSVCEFEGFITKINKGGIEKELFAGPKVAPRSSPLFQLCKIWESINNISLRYKTGSFVEITQEQKQAIFNYLDTNERITFTSLLKLLNIKKEEVYGNKLLINGLQGNKTKVSILGCFDNIDAYRNLFDLEIKVVETDKEAFLIEKATGEVTKSKIKKYVDPLVEEEPLYKLWHTIYASVDKETCKHTLINKFSLPEQTAGSLASLDFVTAGHSNKSHRAMRKMLPYLIEGENDYNARSYAGYYHTISASKHENYQRILLNKIKLLDKNSLRQPVVEKVLNQMINLVNAIIDKFGKPDEIRIELARELKQSREERNDSYKFNTQREKENKEIEKRLEEYGLRASRNNIIKWRLYHEISNEDKKINAICIYCGQPISLTSAILGEEVDIEHIIPQSKLFDDSQSNKTLAHRKCNADKKDQTAFDFMSSKSEAELNEYIERINSLYHSRIIGKAKRDKLLMKGKDIPDDFIDRQLRETQYISRKAREILQSICFNVWCTSGNITSELRHIWGWDDVLMNLQLRKYRELNLTEVITIESNGRTIKKEIIKDWSKRDDHRHHAIDALVIANTQQGFIQRINKLNSGKVRNDMLKEIKDAKANYDNKKNLLENYIYAKRPFTTESVEKEADKILVSFKAGKKSASTGTRKIRKDGKKVIVQNNIIIPRGALSEESVYGKIKIIDKGKSVKFLFENPHLILKDYIRQLVETRLEAFNNNPKDAIKSLKSEPIYLDSEKKIPLIHGTCYKEEVVIKKEIRLLNEKQVEDIIDPVIRKKVLDRIDQFGGKAKDAFKDLSSNPICYNEELRIPINSVRCFTGLSAIEAVSKDADGKEIGFVKPGNNHHLAIYSDENGEKVIKGCTFWHAVERKKYGFPVIINHPDEVIDRILEEPEDTYTDNFLSKLPMAQWNFIESYQQNEIFVLGITNDAFNEAVNGKDYSFISEHLYRVQNVSHNDNQLEINFRYHLETQSDKSSSAKESKRFFRIRSIDSLYKLNPIKIKINCLGDIIN